MKQSNQTMRGFGPVNETDQSDRSGFSARAGEQVKHRCRAQQHSGGAEMSRKLVKRSKF